MLYVLALIGAYFALLVVLSLAARPARVRLVQLGNELIADYPDNQLIRALCMAYAETAYSLRIAPGRLLMYLMMLIQPGDKLDRECDEAKLRHPEFFSDPRILEMMECYYASTSAASPLFGALAYAARLACMVKEILHVRGKRHTRDLTEFVELRAANA